MGRRTRRTERLPGMSSSHGDNSVKNCGGSEVLLSNANELPCPSVMGVPKNTWVRDKDLIPHGTATSAYVCQHLLLTWVSQGWVSVNACMCTGLHYKRNSELRNTNLFINFF